MNAKKLLLDCMTVYVDKGIRFRETAIPFFSWYGPIFIFQIVYSHFVLHQTCYPFAANTSLESQNKIMQFINVYPALYIYNLSWFASDIK